MSSLSSQFTAEYQAFVDMGAFYKHTDEGNAGEFGYVQAGIAGEGGEQLEVYKKVIRDTGVKDDGAFIEAMYTVGTMTHLVKELGDVVWYLVRMCSILGLSMEDLQLTNAVKLYERHMKAKGTKWPFTSITYDKAVIFAERTVSIMCKHAQEELAKKEPDQ